MVASPIFSISLYARLSNTPRSQPRLTLYQIVSFGFTAEKSLLLGVPGGAVEVIALVVSGWAGDRLHNRILFSMLGLCVALLGVILIVALPLHSGGRLAG